MGHPWVFAGELMNSPRGVLPGDLVELQDHKGNFLARGYGNPHSQIAFRALTHRRVNIFDEEFYIGRLLAAWKARRMMGFLQSFRLCFGEMDGLPGIIVDYYLLSEQSGKAIGQLLSVQCSTAGADAIWKRHSELFAKLCQRAISSGLTNFSWGQTIVIQRNDLSVRKLEGLTPEDPRIVHQGLEGIDPHGARFAIGGLTLQADFIEGQKTGFFLDQSRNIQLVTEALPSILADVLKVRREIRIIDLCCYVGHWSARLAQSVRQLGGEAQVTLVDVSQDALAAAQKNVEPYASQVECLRKDVLRDLDDLPKDAFDVVIVDPPAFIKARKDIPAGVAAYTKLFSHGFRIGREDGIVVCCSCSGLLDEENFHQAMRKSIVRSGKRARGVIRGGHSPDHPVSPVFPEGTYLKMQAYLLGKLEDLPLE